MKTILINGLGLMGASLASQLAQLGEYRILGYDRDRETLAVAIANGVIDEAIAITDFDYRQVDLVILGMPPKGIITTINHLATQFVGLAKQPLVMDLGSTKSAIMQAGAKLRHFVGGHPMTGSDKTGIGARQANLYDGRPFFLCGAAADQRAVKTLLAPLQANWQSITAKKHDQIVAGISDLPHVMAFALVNTIDQQTPTGWQTVTAGGFKDTTRIAQANSQLWTEILIANQQATVSQIEALITELVTFKTVLETNNSTQLTAMIEQANRIRRSLS